MVACKVATPIPPQVIITPNLSIPPDFKKVVTFVYKPLPDNQWRPNGTAFFVGLKDESNPTQSFIYIVTAKHVIQDENKNYFPFIGIKLNLRSGGSEIGRIPLSGDGAIHIYLHPNDPFADIAVINLAPDQNKYAYKMIGSELVATREMVKQANIIEGDEAFFIGLFWQFFLDPDMHRKENIPIVRFGRVSLVTDQKIPLVSDGEKELHDLYLIEGQAFGGYSGSPVFFYTRDGQNLLAGVLMGHFTDIRENAGIAYVVPAYKLHEIIFSDELKALRAKSP